MTRASILSCLSPLAAASFALGAHVSSAAEPDGLAALREAPAADDRLDRMIGQTILVGFTGQNEHDQGVKAVRRSARQGPIGGVVLYPDNISSVRQLRLLTAFLAQRQFGARAVDRRGPGGRARCSGSTAARATCISLRP